MSNRHRAVRQANVHSNPAAKDANLPDAPNVCRMSDVVPQAVHWLWPGRIPRGELTLIEGDPQSAKSLLTADLAARVSSGRPMPDGAAGIEPAGVLVLSGEDSVSKTLYHRLQAAGADMDRVAVLSEVVLLPDQLAIVEHAVDEIRAALLVIDPITLYLGRSINNDQSVRAALTPLRALAEQMGVAVVLVRHLNKRVQQAALYRGAGSIGVVAATRSAFAVAKYPARRDWRVLTHTKSNLAPLTGSLAFHVVHNAQNQPSIEWIGPVELPVEPSATAATNPKSKSTTVKSAVASRSPASSRQRQFVRAAASGLFRVLCLTATLATALLSAAEWAAVELTNASDRARKKQRRRHRSRR